MYDVVCIREEKDGGCKGIGVDVNRFMGMVRVRLVDRKHNKCEDLMQTVGDTVLTVPENWVLKIGEVAEVRDPFEVDWELVEIALSTALERQTVKPPIRGTIQHVHRCSSPLPQSEFERTLYQLRPSEVPGKFQGLYPVNPLPANYYIGEFLGDTVPLDEYSQKEHVLQVFQKPTHNDDGMPIKYKRDLPPLHYIDGTNKRASSFVSLVNQALLWPKRFKTSAIGQLRTTRAGVANCEFVQVQDRLYLRTTKEVPPEKELLYEPWKGEPLYMKDRDVLKYERLMEAGTEAPSDSDSGSESPDITEPVKKTGKKKDLKKKKEATPKKPRQSAGTPKTPSTGRKSPRSSTGKKEAKSPKNSPKGQTPTPKRKVSFGTHTETPPAKVRKSSLKKQ
eukprot:TRINITY_DN11411_c0_g1_i1.p1 TRINITY_DN11411_c0_g1~~TRINITY_DN11411_c0_g1_i1.p1  ORF type:complete len:392 (+),score=104.36 TRINITY_DN11411_c0_g1_i1:176-1351(+)